MCSGRTWWKWLQKKAFFFLHRNAFTCVEVEWCSQRWRKNKSGKEGISYHKNFARETVRIVHCAWGQGVKNRHEKRKVKWGCWRKEGLATALSPEKQTAQQERFGEWCRSSCKTSQCRQVAPALETCAFLIASIVGLGKRGKRLQSSHEEDEDYVLKTRVTLC